MINLKTFLITIGILLAIIVGGYFYMQSKFDEVLANVQQDLQKEKDSIAQQKNKVIAQQGKTLQEMRSENEQILIQSKKLYEQLRQKSRNPDYDLDFLQSADVIAKSKYKPGQ